MLYEPRRANRSARPDACGPVWNDAPMPDRKPSDSEEPHDVLAAEEFAVPAPETGRVPPDPTGIEQPHDVLAAEEFAMPTREQRAPVDPSGIRERV